MMTRIERAAKAGGITIPEAEVILKAAYPELYAGTHFVCTNLIWLGVIEATNRGTLARKKKDPKGEIMAAFWQPICDEQARMRNEYGPHPPSKA
jgi:hypothetical protein